MTDEELNELVERLEFRADNGDMGRKPDPATLDRLTIAAIRQLMRERDEAVDVICIVACDCASVCSEWAARGILKEPTPHSCVQFRARRFLSKHPPTPS